MAELNLWLDSYDDIYSDFDSRHYLKRRISEDFLHELRTEMKFKQIPAGDLVLMVPQEQRNETTEKIITGSLAGFFNSRLRFFRKKCRMKLNSGLLLFLAGAVMMLLGTWVSYRSAGSWSVVFLKIILEPAGWFLIWAAFDFLFYDFAELKKEKNFFRELSHLQVHFKTS